MKKEENKEVEFGLPSIGIPAEVLFNPKITKTEKILFGFLRNLSQKEEGCWASNRYLGIINGIKPQTVSVAISNLKKWGYITVEYSTNISGVQIRHIHISTDYPKTYRKLVTDWYKHIKSPMFSKERGNKIDKLSFDEIKMTLLQKSKPPMKIPKKPSDKNGIKVYKEIYKKEGNHIQSKNEENEENFLKNLSYEEKEKISRKNLYINKKEKFLEDFDPSIFPQNLLIEPEHFDLFWTVYPKSRDKGKAKTFWRDLTKEKDRPSLYEILSAVLAQKETSQWARKDQKYISVPFRWLSEQKWLNDPATMIDTSTENQVEGWIPPAQ